MWLANRDVAALGKLWAELSDFSASQPDEALNHCLRSLCAIIGAENGLWVCGIRERRIDPTDGLRGWRPRGTLLLHRSDERDRRMAAVLSRHALNDIDPQTKAMINRAGVSRSFMRPELVDNANWERSWLYQEILRPDRVEDRLMGAHTVTPLAESYIVLDRSPADRRFGERERNFLGMFLLGSQAFHRHQMLVRGHLEAARPLSRRERQVLRHLLTDATEAEIADRIGVRASFVHQYITSIYRKFDVSGRTGLLSLWFRNRIESGSVETVSRSSGRHAHTGEPPDHL